jgi:hypothetical protein
MASKQKLAAWAVALGLIGSLLWINFRPQENAETATDESAALTEQNQTAPAELESDGTPSFQSGTASALTREGELLEAIIQLIDPAGNQVEGQVWLINKSSSLIERTSVGHFVFTSLWGDDLLAEDRTANGRVSFPLTTYSHKANLIAVIGAPGFAPRAVELNQGTFSATVTLAPVAMIQMRVVDTDGAPVVGAYCWQRPSSYSDDSFHTWIQNFEAQCFGSQIITENDGVALFPTPYAGEKNTFQVTPTNGLAGGTVSGIAPGSEIVMECKPGFAASGIVADAETGFPIANASVMFNVESAANSQTILSYRTLTDGSYRVEALPANASVVTVNVVAAEYADATFHILKSESAPLVLHDFLLTPAKGVELQLLTSWQEPIEGANVRLRRGRYQWESPFIRTNEKGVANFPAILAQDSTFELLIQVGGFFWAQPDHKVRPGSTETVVIPNLSRIESIKIESELPEGFLPKKVLWAATANENQGTVKWNFGSPSPLLPCGFGHLSLVSEQGLHLESTPTLPQGITKQLAFNYSPCQLNFKWMGPGEAVVTVASRSGEWVINEEAFPPGVVSLDLWQGIFSLTVEHEGGIRRWVNLTLDSDSLDLGVVESTDGAATFGVVRDDRGNPLEDVFVALFASDQGYSIQGYTDVNGEFSLEGGVPGSHFLVSSGSNAYGGDFHESVQEVFLRPHSGYGPLEIILARNADSLTGKVIPSPPFGTSAILTGQGATAQIDLTPEDEFRLPVPNAGGWLGALALQRGLVYFAASEVSEGVQHLNLAGPASSHTVRIVDENGRAWNNLIVYAYPNGSLATGYAVPNADGTLRLDVNPGLPLNLQFRLPSGRAIIKSIDELLASDTLVLTRNASEVMVTVIDESGVPIQMAAALHYGVGDAFQADGYGRLKLPQTDADHPYLLEAPGHLGVWDDATASRTVVLPTMLFDLSLNIAAEVRKAEGNSPATVAQLQPLDVPETALFTGSMDVALTGGNTALTPLPAGRIRVTLFDADGGALAEREFVLNEHEQVLRWK